jgi:hypothetical protein
VGFEVFEVIDDDVQCILFFDKMPRNIPLSELIFAIKRIAKSADAILVNIGLRKDELSVEEALFIQLAYTINTPIFGVGNTNNVEFLSTVVLNTFETFEDALDHIKSNYGGKNE